MMMRTATLITALLLTGWAGSSIARAAEIADTGGKHGEFANESIDVAEAKRVYRLVVPKSVDLAKPVPLVIAFHGFLIDSKDVMPRYTKLSDAAAKHKFILAYPEAVDKSWGIWPKKVKNDLAFFDALVAKLAKDYRIDPARIYAVGMSNGGYFAHVVGKERSNIVAAVASHSAPLGLLTLRGVKAERKFPVLIIHGDQDNIVPVAQGRESRVKYEKEGHPVKYVEIAGLGHFWGVKSDINETIWSFFAEHPLEKK